MAGNTVQRQIETKGSRDEIEKAIDRVKKSAKRTEGDSWFKKQWYRCLAVRLKRKRQLEK